MNSSDALQDGSPLEVYLVQCGGFLGGSVVKNLPVIQETRFDHKIGKIPGRREWQPTPVFLPGKSLGQRSLAGYSPRGHKESKAA